MIFFIEINGVKYILKDTAGIRKTKDLVEKIGVLKTVEKIKDKIYNLKEKEISNKETDILILNERQQVGIKKERLGKNR